MRACEGCRRRKIKCDAATTNAWPCTACIRLKLHCVPPTAVGDREMLATGQYPDTDGISDYAISSMQMPNSVQDQASLGQYTSIPMLHTPAPTVEYDPSATNYQLHPSSFAPAGQQQVFRGITGVSIPASTAHPSQSYYSPQHSQVQPKSRSTSDSGQSTVGDLSEALGELKIDESGIGMYKSSLRSCCTSD